LTSHQRRDVLRDNLEVGRVAHSEVRGLKISRVGCEEALLPAETHTEPLLLDVADRVTALDRDARGTCESTGPGQSMISLVTVATASATAASAIRRSTV